MDGGELAFAKGTRVALHDQRAPLDLDLSLEAYVVGGSGEPLELEADLRRLEEAMAAGAHDAKTLAAYARAQERFEHAGGYVWRERAAAIARGLGFADADLPRPLETFSGGEVTKASLARALVGEPDLLLLDEPTNHLDVSNLEWLEEKLEDLGAACVIVAHDRWFLEAVTTATLELEAGRSTYFAGPWHVWRREKAERAQTRREDGQAHLGGHRTPRALRGALPLQEVEGQAGPGEADAHFTPGAGEGRCRRGAHAPDAPPARGALLVHRAPAQRTPGARARG